MRIFKITTGTSRFDKHWRVREVSWDDLKKRLSRDNPTGETLAEYEKMSKDQRDKIKDCGGFVGGAIRGRARKKDAVISRSLVTLDLDNAEQGFWDNFSALNDYAALVYSTHSHSPQKPRLRLIIPLDRDCTPEEYIAVARKVAEDIGIDQCDKTTYQPERLMYYPSHPADAEWVFESQDGDLLSVDDTLARYADWHDVSQYPTAADEVMAVGYEVRHIADPLTKGGVIGAFNRTYTISEAIEKFLPEVYVPGAMPGRYTYAQGSSTNGAVVYNDDTVLYSNHATDPAAGHACNAYDLVRIHRFGDLDKNWDGDAGRAPSDKAMAEFIAQDEDVSRTITLETAAACEADFADIEAVTAETKKDPSAPASADAERSMDKVVLSRDKAGNALPTIDNFLTVLRYDPALSNLGRYNEFTKRMEVNGILPWNRAGDRRGAGSPWNDADQAGFRYYCEVKYKLKGKDAARDAVVNYYNMRGYHPVREYLAGLTWDGKERVDTLFIDYLGAEDTPYVRTVTRKMMTAGVARIMRPGCKWDFMLTLTGAQGIGKSTLFRRLGHGWYDDSLTDVRTKDAYDQIQGVWIVEMAELTATRRADVEAVKQFISRQVDSYRKAYGEFKNDYPRECIFVGTTNDDAFLVDKTGNRRFWAVEVGVNRPSLSVWDDLTEDVVGQLWAEAKYRYDHGEELYLSAEMQRLAVEAQERHSDDLNMRTDVENCLETLLPPDWSEYDLGSRRLFWMGSDVAVPKGSAGCTVRRDVVCVLELACELYGIERSETNRMDVKHTMLDLRKIMDCMPGWRKFKKQKWIGGPYGGGRRDAYYRVGSEADEHRNW